jgi:hypothetical protein
LRASASNTAVAGSNICGDFDMRNTQRVVLGSLLIVGLAGPLASQEQRPPVRAKEPTVVTVEGRAEEVQADKDKRERGRSGGPLVQGVRTIGRGTVWVGKRISNWLDFNFDGEQVVPSERERREKEQKRSER